MNELFANLIACPACGGTIADNRCQSCGEAYVEEDGILRLRAAADRRTEAVREFYEAAPFPGYPPRDSLQWLRARAERSAFARLLDQAIDGDARIVEVGCGTGQMSLYLARADRVVVGADLTMASLRLAEAARRRFGLERAAFVESDLNRPGLSEGAFDVVYCSGVLHHTPDPKAAFARVARLAKPGGMIVLGLYNAVARIPLRLRRVVARATNYRWIPFDPVLNERALEPARREAWLRDQYRHPEEHLHTVGEVLKWFRTNDVAFVRAYPSAQIGGESPEDLFAPEPDAWAPERWLAQIGWIGSLGGEGGLWIMVGQRSAAPDEPTLKRSVQAGFKTTVVS